MDDKHAQIAAAKKALPGLEKRGAYRKLMQTKGLIARLEGEIAAEAAAGDGSSESLRAQTAPSPDSYPDDALKEGKTPVSRPRTVRKKGGKKAKK